MPFLTSRKVQNYSCTQAQIPAKSFAWIAHHLSATAVWQNRLFESKLQAVSHYLKFAYYSSGSPSHESRIIPWKLWHWELMRALTNNSACSLRTSHRARYKYWSNLSIWATMNISEASTAWFKASMTLKESLRKKEWHLTSWSGDVHRSPLPDNEAAPWQTQRMASALPALKWQIFLLMAFGFSSGMKSCFCPILSFLGLKRLPLAKSAR